MAVKKITLLAAIALMVACVPMSAGATPITPPTYNMVVTGASQITGTSVSALTLTATFPNGGTGSTRAAGGGARWSIPVSGSLREGDTIRLMFTDGTNSGLRFITVESAGTNLDGSPAGGGGGSTGGAVTGDGGGTTTDGTGTTDTTSDSSLPKTGNTAPMFLLAGGLFAVGLVLVFLTQRLWARAQR